MNSYVEDYIEKLKEYSGYKYLVRKYKREYNLLFDDLFSIEFRWHVALDAKRIDDAEYYIRDKFDDGTLEKLGYPVSVLEVLLAKDSSWWLRTPNTYYLSCTYVIGANNKIGTTNAYDKNGVRPAFCCIKLFLYILFFSPFNHIHQHVHNYC